MKHCFFNLLMDESGQDLIEYALITALVSLAAITGLNALQGAIKNALNSIGSDLTSAM
jgi:pilus assembly protein Flp/PilA